MENRLNLSETKIQEAPRYGNKIAPGTPAGIGSSTKQIIVDLSNDLSSNSTPPLKRRKQYIADSCDVRDGEKVWKIGIVDPDYVAKRSDLPPVEAIIPPSYASLLGFLDKKREESLKTLTELCDNATWDAFVNNTYTDEFANYIDNYRKQGLELIQTQYQSGLTYIKEKYGTNSVVMEKANQDQAPSFKP